MKKIFLIVISVIGLVGVFWLITKKSEIILNPLSKIRLKKEENKEFKTFGFLPTWMVGKTRLYGKELSHLIFLGVEVDSKGNLIWDYQAKKINSKDFLEQKEKITFKTIVNGHPDGTLYSEITLQVNSGPFFEIKFTKPITRNNNSYSTVDITKDEYNYLNDFFYEINKKLRKIRNEKGVDELEKDIIPYKKDAKKYNL